jgi:hypothetical protein
MLNTQFILDNGTYILKVDPAKLEATRRWLIANNCKFSFRTIRRGYTIFSIRSAPSSAIASISAKHNLISLQPILPKRFDVVGGVVLENPAQKFVWL